MQVAQVLDQRGADEEVLGFDNLLGQLRDQLMTTT
jgi:hypothetical protein